MHVVDRLRMSLTSRADFVILLQHILPLGDLAGWLLLHSNNLLSFLLLPLPPRSFSLSHTLWLLMLRSTASRKLGPAKAPAGYVYTRTRTYIPPAPDLVQLFFDFERKLFPSSFLSLHERKTLKTRAEKK